MGRGNSREVFIEKGEVYVGDANRRVRVGAIFKDEDNGGAKMVRIYHLGSQGGHETISYDDFIGEFEKETM